MTLVPPIGANRVRGELADLPNFQDSGDPLAVGGWRITRPSGRATRGSGRLVGLLFSWAG
jgi:hypothetical protein